MCQSPLGNALLANGAANSQSATGPKQLYLTLRSGHCTKVCFREGRVTAMVAFPPSPQPRPRPLQIEHRPAPLQRERAQALVGAHGHRI